MENSLTAEHLLDIEQTIANKIFHEIRYPWEVLDKIENYILELSKTLDKNRFNEIEENIFVAKTANVAPSAFLIGPIIIDENAQIRHCAFLRGNVIVGKNTVIGNSCEIKNSIIFNNAQIPHYNYVGDSVLGYKSHMGAGSITSNVKSDKSMIWVRSKTEKIATNRKKFGAILGDFAEIGCNAVLNPGTIIGRNSSIYPSSSVRGVIPENSIFKSSDIIVSKN